MSNVKVAFICVHNSCRSQIAEAFGRHLASDVFQSYSAGTETKPQINQDAVRIMKELYFQLVHQMMALHSIFLAEVFLHQSLHLRLEFSM